MNSPAPAAEFFRVGGTLHLDVPSYVPRPADDELLEQVEAGQFCYVLTSRQMGKSSLMLRTATRLRQQGVRPAIIDLSSLGTQQVSAEQWYLGLIKRLGLELKLPVEPETWWHDRNHLAPVQRFTDFLHDVVLAEVEGQVVIFIDEIDSTLGLPFTDDFFAAIRYVYNRRASQPEYDRLTFVLLGVAAPNDLIQDPQRTPFNIGQAINLQELRRVDAQPLLAGLEQAWPGQGERLLDRVFYWTAGHPYLTQKLCRALVEIPADDMVEERVDRLVDWLFFSEEARTEDNLQFVRRNIEARPERRRLVQLYWQVYQGRDVAEDEQALLQNRLKLIGLVKGVNKRLQVRNEIYRCVFNVGWIQENLPVLWTQWVTLAAVFISILAVTTIFVFQRWQAQQELETKVTTYVERFHRSGDADIRFNSLAGLCQLERQLEAQSLFFDLPPDQQLDLLRKVKIEGAGPKLTDVVDCLYPGIESHVTDPGHRQVLTVRMCCTLSDWNNAAGREFSRQTGAGCECREQEYDDDD